MHRNAQLANRSFKGKVEEEFYASEKDTAAFFLFRKKIYKMMNLFWNFQAQPNCLYEIIKVFLRWLLFAELFYYHFPFFAKEMVAHGYGNGKGNGKRKLCFDSRTRLWVPLPNFCLFITVSIAIELIYHQVGNVSGFCREMGKPISATQTFSLNFGSLTSWQRKKKMSKQ